MLEVLSELLPEPLEALDILTGLKETLHSHDQQQRSDSSVIIAKELTASRLSRRYQHITAAASRSCPQFC